MGLTAADVQGVKTTVDKIQKDGIPFDINLDENTIKTTAKWLLLAIAGGVALGGFFLALFQRLLRTYRP